MFLIGKVVKPQGIMGEIKVLPFLDSPNEFCKIAKLNIGSSMYIPTSVRVSGDFVFLKLEGITDRDNAELLRDKQIFVSKNDMPPLPKDRYYISDVIGSLVWVGDKLLGKVKDISQYGSADIYEVDSEKGRVLFPLLTSLIVDIDVQNKKIVLNASEFSKVAVYED